MILYRYVLLTLAAPVLALRLGWALAARRLVPADLRERLGLAAAPVARGPVIWLHAASVGEATAARGLAETILARDRRAQAVVTSNSQTGRAQVQSWGMDRVTARLAPLDYRWALLGFLGSWQPAALVTVENEIWPNRMALCRQRRIPVMVAGARLSARSSRAWRLVPRTAAAVMRLVDHLAAQDADSEARFLALGLPSRVLGERMNLKSTVRLAAVGASDLAPFAALARGATLLAASTHPGEEEQVLEAFRQARAKAPELKLILAPRHPERGEAVAALVAARGLVLRRRSAGELPDAQTDVYLADTLGEMALWYRLAAMTFIGGSLVEKGGHTPFEPALCDSAILHGPHTGNAPQAYQALEDAGAAVAVRDPQALAQAVLGLMSAPDRRTGMAAKARAALARIGGARGTDAFVEALGRLTGNPALQRRLED